MTTEKTLFRYNLVFYSDILEDDTTEIIQGSIADQEKRLLHH